MNMKMVLEYFGGVFGLVLALIGMGLFLYFIFKFLVPAISGWRVLNKINSRLRAFPSRPTPKDLGKVFGEDDKLKHQWVQYCESLHDQKQGAGEAGNGSAWRATLPAEVFFNPQNIVENRVNAEFFKHLPGILTGIGIIGTFSGLINGLEGFNVSGDPGEVKTSLDSLMRSVKHAFGVSACAIMVAMAVTALEKFLLAHLCGQVEFIAGAIDKFFEGGVGEEYLSRLVTASEDSASQAKILKDALVKDLGDLLKNLTESQIRASVKLNNELMTQIRDSAEQQSRTAQEHAGIMSSVISGSIRQSLENPLQQIAQSVQSATRDQSASATQMLSDVMAGFSERLNSLFGEQINGINELNRQTAQGMQGAAESLQALVIRLEESSLRSANAMSTQTTQAITAMSDGLSGIQDRVLENNRAREEAMNARTHELISEMSNRVGVAMREVSSTTTSALNELTVSLKNSQARTLKDTKAREEQMVQKTQEMVSALAEQVGVVVDRLSATTTGSLQSLVSNFEAVGQRSAQEMSNRLAASMEAMEVRQNSMNSQAAGFVDQIGKLIASSQSQTHQQLTGTLATLREETSGLLNGLRKAQTDVVEQQNSREKAMLDRVDTMNAHAHDLISEMSNRVGAAMNEVSATTTGALNELTVNLRNSQARTLKDTKAREEQMVQKTQEMVSALAEQVGIVVDRLSATTTGSLQSLVSNFEAVGQRSAQEMSNRLAASMEAMEARQNSMNSQAAGFVDQIGKLIASSQSQTHQQLTGTLAALGEETSGLLNGLRKAQTDVVEQQDAREKTMLDRVEKLVGEMTRMVDKVVHASNDATQKMAHGVNQLSSVSTKAISGMNAGAEQINLSADKFAEAGKGVAGVITQAATISSRMDSASRSLSDGAKSLAAELQDHQLRRNEMAQLQRDVCAIAETTRREVGLTADVLQRIGKSVSGIQDAQGRIDKYIDGVHEVLEKFKEELCDVSDRTNKEFQSELDRSVKLLRVGIEEFARVVDGIQLVGSDKI